MKRGLVLSGGGSRGAYEIGVWQALQELDVRFNAVYGTSIGALNAALIAQGDVDAAIDLWENITLSQVVEIDEDEDFTIDRMVARKRDVIPFLLDNKKYLRMDISPLEQLVQSRVSEARIRASGIELGVMTCRVPQMQMHPVLLGDMEAGALADWVLASASCFPIFPTRSIGGQRYIDGGYCDNLPIDMAVENGCDEIIAVELHPDYTHPEYARMPWLRVIRPLHSLGGFLDFSPHLMRRSRMIGYHDAMKAYGALDGFLYSFRRVNALSVSDTAKKYTRCLTRFDSAILRNSGNIEDPPLITAIEAETNLKKLDWKDIWLRGVELCARAAGFREDAIYDAGQLTGYIMKYAQRVEPAERFDEAAVREAAKRDDSRYLTAWLMRMLMLHGEYPEACLKRLAEHPVETAAALFLYCESGA